MRSELGGEAPVFAGGINIVETKKTANIFMRA